jgi:hypothetical protein
MKKKLLILGTSILILGSTQFSYGAALALEDDPLKPGEKSRVGAHLEDQIAREEEARERQEALGLKALEDAATAGEGDAIVKREFLTARQDEDGFVHVLFKITDAEGIEGTEAKDLPRKEEVTWLDGHHDNVAHHSVPLIKVYGESEEGEKYYIEGERLGEPVVHRRLDDRVGAWENDGAPYEEGGKRYQKKKRKVWYKRVGIDDFEYTVYEQGDPVEIAMPRVVAAAPAPAPRVDVSPPSRPSNEIDKFFSRFGRW